MPSDGLPHFASGEVVKGFGRGSKQLGCPTTNFAPAVINCLPKEIETGVYFGFARVDKGPVYKMVMSVGWNPYYHNKEKSMETHILHKFQEDFYGKQLQVIMLGYIRPQKDFSSVDQLIKAINDDIDVTDKILDTEETRGQNIADNNFCDSDTSFCGDENNKECLHESLFSKATETRESEEQKLSAIFRPRVLFVLTI